MDRSDQLAKLLNPASVAVLGASQRAGWGLTTIQNLDGIGFAGQIYPVNPRYQEVAGRQCFPSLRDLPQPPDAVVIAVPAAGVPAAVEEAAECGAGAAVVYASGFGAPGEGEGGTTGPDSLRARMRGFSADKQIAIQGPNCLGTINYARRAAMWGITMPFEHAGAENGVALIAQSGNMALTLAGTNRGFRLSHLVSCGNQFDVTAAELVAASLADPAVRAIAVMLESIPDPDRFRVALLEAAERDVPVVVLKVGTSERARQAAIAHTGSLSGSAAVHRSFFRQYGAVQVDDLDELAATVTVLSAPQRPRGGGVAIFASSGGECGLSSDVAQSVGVVLPDLPENIADELTGLLPDFAHVTNPLDLTAGGWGDAELYGKVIELLARAPGVSSVVGIGDAPTLGGGELVAGWKGIIHGLHAGADRVRASGVVVAGLSSVGDLHPDVPRRLADGGVVPLAGLRPGLSALAKAGWYAQWRAARAQAAATGENGRGAYSGSQAGGIAGEIGAADAASATRLLLNGKDVGAVAEELAKRVLACYGVHSPGRELAGTAGAAAEAAARIGYPVAMKVAAAGIQHKTEVGGVRLNLRRPDEVTQAADELLDLGRRSDPAAMVLVEQFVPPGLELIVGARRDEMFGPIVMVGLGGILTEFLEDVSHRLAPVSITDAEAMISELAGRRLLDGFRGQRGADVSKLARLVVAISRLMTDHEEIAELDINPVVADPASGDLLALDALLVLADPGRRRLRTMADDSMAPR
jgi:acetate---CoA ligase (ADP-forming)